MTVVFLLKTNNPIIKSGEQNPGSVYLGVTSVECCGWMHITNLEITVVGDKWVAKTEFVEALKSLMHDKCFFPVSIWSNRYRQQTNFPLYLVLGSETQNKSNWGEILLNLGWIKGTPFFNPNTGNINTPYQFIPEEFKV